MDTIRAARTLLTGRLIPWGIVALMAVSAAHAGTSHSTGGTGAPMTRAQLTEYVQNLVGGQRQDMERIALLEHACSPVSTGGGVTQCANPTTYDLKFAHALRACMLSTAYVGSTQEDTWALHAQCMDDYWTSHP